MAGSTQQISGNGKIWNRINFVLAVLTIINFFGDLGEITFSQWLQNVIDAYELIIMPIIAVVQFPFDFLFGIQFSDEQTNLMLMLFFMFDRLASDFLLTVFNSMETLAVPEKPRELMKYDYFQKRKKLRRIFIRTHYAWAPVAKFLLKPTVNFIAKKLITILASVGIAYAAGNDTVIFTDQEAGHYMAVFFLCLFAVPAICFILYFFQSLLGFVMSFLIYPVQVIVLLFLKHGPKIWNWQTSLEPFKFNSMLEPPMQNQLFRLATRQLLFTLTFTVVVFIIIGVNYQFGILV